MGGIKQYTLVGTLVKNTVRFFPKNDRLLDWYLPSSSFIYELSRQSHKYANDPYDFFVRLF